MAGCAGARAASAPQTLMLMSPADTTVLPSGEKATDCTEPLCAFCFSATKVRDDAPA